LDNFLTANRLNEGDVLAINFTNVKTRRDHTLDTVLTDSDLCVIKNGIDTSNVARGGVVPICKIFDGRLFLINGRVFEENTPGTVILTAGSGGGVTHAELADQTAPDSGDTLIGCNGKTQGSVTVSQGTLNAQLNEILAEIDGITPGGGSSAVLVVDSAGSGDYTTIQGAVTATLGSGVKTRILIMGHDTTPYTESVTLGVGDLDCQLEIIGVGNVVWKPLPTTPCLIVTSSNETATIAIKNIFFDIDIDTNAINYQSGMTTTTLTGLVLENCIFYHSDFAATTSPFIRYASHRVTCDNCLFKNITVAHTGSAFSQNYIVSDERLEVTNCKFENILSVWKPKGRRPAPRFSSFLSPVPAEFSRMLLLSRLFQPFIQAPSMPFQVAQRLL